MMGVETWAPAVARRLGLTGEIEFSTARVGQTLHVPCSRGHIVDVTVPIGFHPDGIAKRMLAAGWTMGRKLVCPDCKPQKKAKNMDHKTNKTVGHEGASIVAISTAQSDAAKRAHRLVMMELEEAYDEAKKGYKPGYSDAKIAQDTGASETHVRNTREQYFGPIAEPSELSVLREELAQVRLEAKLAWDASTDRIAKVEQRINSLVKANGWKS